LLIRLGSVGGDHQLERGGPVGRSKARESPSEWVRSGMCLLIIPELDGRIQTFFCQWVVPAFEHAGGGGQRCRGTVLVESGVTRPGPAVVGLAGVAALYLIRLKLRVIEPVVSL